MRRTLAALLSVLLASPAWAADNTVILTPGTGVTMRTKDVGSGVQSGIVILGDTSGNAIYGTAGTANANVITIQGIASGTVVPVSGTVTAAQATAANLNATVVGTGTFAVQSAQSGTYTVGLSAAQTLATVTTVGTVTNLSQFGAAAINLGAGAVGTGTLRITQASDSPEIAALGAPADSVCGTATGTCSMIALQKYNNSTNPVLAAGTNVIGDIRNITGTFTTIPTFKIDQTTVGTTNAISLAQIGATTVVNGGLAGSLSIGGTVATNVAITDNPVNTGGQAVSSENAVVTTARKVQFVADLTGRQIMMPYSNPENWVQGTTSAMTGTTTTSLLAAPASGLRNYAWVSCVNSHATVGTFVSIQDGSGGTTLGTLAAAPAYGGQVMPAPIPIRQPTTATALFVANVTTGANVICTATGFKSAL